MSVFISSLKSEEEAQLKSIARNGKDVKLARRAQVVLASSKRISIQQIAQVLGYTDVQVRRIIHAFEKGGIEGLRSRDRGGRPRIFTHKQRRAIVELVASRPRDLGIPLSQWSLSTLQAVLIKQKKVSYISRPTISSVLKEAGFTKQRTKTWKESNDPLYEKKTHKTPLRQASKGFPGYLRG